MPYFAVELACIIKQTAQVIVKCKSREELAERLSDVYQIEEGRAEWSIDGSWGSVEGTHTLLKEVDPDFQGWIVDLDKNEFVWKTYRDASESLDGDDVDFSIRFEDLADDQVIVRAFLNGDRDNPLIFTADYTWQPDVDQDGNALVFRTREEAASAISKLVKDIK